MKEEWPTMGHREDPAPFGAGLSLLSHGESLNQEWSQWARLGAALFGHHGTVERCQVNLQDGDLGLNT